MKRTVMTGMLLTAALFATAPVFAAEDLCDANLKKIDSDLTTAKASNPDIESSFADSIKEAKDAQAAHDQKKCIAASDKVLSDLEKMTTKGGAAGN
ncbi:hypothetical protein [Pseudomonas typographi]|uniref:Uncharacterized protein n=1 Tax=Pseudomonas typographi TaxID=2715964 RepID=A0ABR7Z6V4_9PSED|nr:hypothetical protein [Pseudomonas typographi]MBD1553787.1 hypothetical protein [Pseudomonas typographi]MBD1601073.1 hypothetical protein [Pseudomonas typographi]